MSEPKSDAMQDAIEKAKEKTVRHLFFLGYGAGQIASVTGLSMDRVFQIVQACQPKREGA